MVLFSRQFFEEPFRAPSAQEAKERAVVGGAVGSVVVLLLLIILWPARFG
jgi:hypothetical protein